ncbi:MAG: serine--tRNA ligase [Acidobacteria bacterium RIFCSPLOWO2_12_FULL_59_11]|nr:MAG: serine--tRNA ligase [Acidobacteria bacterium RIFCSPLOWO2_12_FULL_59_11]
MLDLAFVRENLELLERKLLERGLPGKLDVFREVDQKRRRLLTEVETLKNQRNRASEEIGRLKQQGVDVQERIQETKARSEEIKLLDVEVERLDAELREFLVNIPNMPHSSVPVGSSPADNQEVRRWGEPRHFSFSPRPHWELGEALGILDQGRAAKITGARFAVYWDLGARLERALANFMLDTHGREHGYREVLPPAIVNSASLFGTGNLPKFAGDLFRLENTDWWLIPTAEVPVTNLFRDEVLDAAELPISLMAYTSCFRSEAGSYGKETRGIVRQHQFQKVELVKFAHPSTSYEQLEILTRHSEAILQKLNLPYRVVALCTADLGFSSAKTYDLEVWLPSQGEYKEISSCSNFESFQARRANVRFRAGGKGKSEFVHTLNGSGLAVGRTWMAVVENYQEEDGSVVIPEALRDYLRGAERITADARLVKK